MFTWISLALALLRIASQVIDYVERRKIITEAERNLIRRQTEEINARLAKASDARDAAERDFDARGVQPDDPNLRD